ncbi:MULTISPECIES: protein-L-isoaspartate O-methyltransferase family protein [Paracoccus]|uniref:Protein-L-isoaspartate O-methyltransferase n=1 Tax=Paracoccus versutus TaxID=34007 RepID=A0A369U0I6_PARVE|nr:MULTISPECIES: protein-L-isoaspartate O-methyltransferase [Paracoccus]WGR60870.1 protein-L-isoaspartate O-methyltransferase [Paracoccus ferrooxidans]SFX41184.1 protein-L-isoaspartate(D-aspartate) O-methyltransferase [Paracoccus pantotrophus]MBT0780055.1 protein-L-isoaspartate O-methyltransferase [Paracoccus sp. pheM1]MCJ1903126.1 protein-L-isoaspartate O-methyltransferase [Paracoccus versutus]MDF3906919.1 protein-L-isoaspartate O-methyltransferase [Paracoccus sp. AS002]
MTDFAQRRTMMVDTQVRPNEVTSYPVIEAMLNVPREQFVPESRRDVAYVGNNIDLAPGRVLLEPRTLGKMMDVLDLQNGDLVLDVGCGYGYSAAVMARIAEAVVALEEDAAMAAEAESRLAAQDVFNVAVVQGALAEGCASQAPYDAILIEGAVEQVPEALADQLREGGRIVAMFREGNLGTVRIGHKLDGRLNWRFGFHATAPLLPGFARPRGFVL